MRIAICSDSHDNLMNISQFLAYGNEQKIKTIIHCGDWCAPSTLRFFRENFKGKIYGVYGNVFDGNNMEKFAAEQNIIIKNDELNVSLGKIKALITHFPDKAKKLAATNKFNLILYGHSHKPWMEKIKKTILINPGTLAGMFTPATFAIFNTLTKKIELKRLDQLT